MNNSRKAKPEQLPAPTYWPFFLALGVTFIFWGILTIWLITGIGGIVFAVALSGWIMDIFKEMQKNKDNGM